jgi:hypothetical protein
MTRPAWLGVRCPYCGASAGERCVETRGTARKNPRGRILVDVTSRSEPHPSRLEAAVERSSAQSGGPS